MGTAPGEEIVIRPASLWWRNPSMPEARAADDFEMKSTP
jgi:hypothetical protein